MSDSNPHQVSRRDFSKGTAAVISGLIGVLIGIPSIAYLLSPAVKSQRRVIRSFHSGLSRITPLEFRHGLILPRRRSMVGSVPQQTMACMS
jgi:hypothetical protein